MSARSVSFVLGDRTSRPPKANRMVQHIIRDVFTAQGFIGIGIILQALCASILPRTYALVPGIVFIAIASLPTVLNITGLQAQSEETAAVLGRTSAFLDFADPSHAGKQPGAPALIKPDGSTHERRAPPKLALMLIGSQCRSRLGALQPEFKQMGEVFAAMIAELRAAPPEDDVGFLNAEFYMHGANTSGNSNMVCMYWKSCDHIMRFAHKEGSQHWPAWNKYRALERERYKLFTEIGLWHEVYEISNAEAIYDNMPRTGLGDMWDAVPTPDGRVVYRNPLVVANGCYVTLRGRMGYKDGKEGENAPVGTRCPVSTAPYSDPSVKSEA